MTNMTKYAVVEQGFVVNIVVGNEPQSNWFAAHDNVKIGWGWNGASFVKPAPLAPTAQDVDTECERRLGDGFVFNGIRFQSGPQSRSRIDRAYVSALAALMGGAQPGNTFWADPDQEFVWIAEDDARIAMDAQTAVLFGKTQAVRYGKHILKANDLKKMQPIPADFKDDTYWP